MAHTDEVAMQSQFDVNPYASGPVQPPRETSGGGETVELLRQILEQQKEQVNLLRASVAAHDVGSRWRTFLARWREDFPDLSDSCKEALLILEKAYGALIAEMVEFLRQNGTGALDSEFTLQEFLDRYGMRLAQLGTILNLVAPLAEASQQGGTS